MNRLLKRHEDWWNHRLTNRLLMYVVAREQVLDLVRRPATAERWHTVRRSCWKDGKMSMKPHATMAMRFLHFAATLV